MINMDSIMTLIGLMLTCFSMGYVLGNKERANK